MKGALAFHAFRLVARLLLFLLIAAAISWVFLVRRSGDPSFSEGISETLKGKLGAGEIQLQGLTRERGEFYVGRMAMTGGDDTFFTALEAAGLKCEMGLLDEFRSRWEPGDISIMKLDIGLRAGADSPESAESIADVLFQENGAMQVSTITVSDANLRWGYSERTSGGIIGSKMWVHKVAGGWKLRFRGGTFSQNWLKDLEIEELEVVLGRQGVVFEKAIFRKGSGFVSLLDGKVQAGERPELSGVVTLSKVDVSPLLAPVVRDYIEGSVSGQFKVFGSTNSSDGVGFEGEISLDGEDRIVLRDKVELLHSLRLVDSSNNYRRIEFREGSFLMRSQGGRLEFTQVQLGAGDYFSMKGEMAVRQPVFSEVMDFERSTVPLGESGLLGDDDTGLTLRRAGESSGTGEVGFAKSDDESLFARLGLGAASRRLEAATAARLAQAYRYEGLFTITLSQNAFAKAPKLQALYPGNGANGRVVIDVPINGMLSEITVEQAKLIDEKAAK